jgi:cation/acetate symporter
LYIFAYKGFFFISGTELLANTPANHLFGISPEAFGTVGAIINFTVAFIFMKMSAPVPAEIEAMVEDIRIPKGAGAAQDH